MKRLLITFILIIAFVLALPLQGLAWGSATHVYFGDELGRSADIMNKQEMYGALLPDVFNLMFGSPYKEYLWNEVNYEYMKIVNRAKGCPWQALVYGFASHSEGIGAGYTAHLDAQSIPGPGGYVVIKRAPLAATLTYVENNLADKSIDTCKR